MPNAITSSSSGNYVNHKGNVPELGAAAKASLAKGKAEREAKVAAPADSTTVSISKEGASKLATENKADTTAKAGTTAGTTENKADATAKAGATAGTTATTKAKPADNPVTRADARQADQAAWRAAHTKNPSKSQTGATTTTATASTAQGATSAPDSSGGKVKFGSVDEAIAYGAKRATEQYQKQQQALRG